MSPVQCSEVDICIVLPEVVVLSVFEMAMKCLAYAELSSVAVIYFFGWEESICPYSASAGDFFERLTSVHTLFTDVNALALSMYLTSEENMNIPGRPNTILPSLSVVNLEMHTSYRDNFPVDEQTAAFFLSRLQSGYPVRTLNLSDKNSEPFLTSPNLDALEEVKGLKVIYKLRPTKEIFEYICGSGCFVRRPGGTA